MAHFFQVNRGHPGLSLSGPPAPVPEENHWGLVEQVFLHAGCPSCRPVISVNAVAYPLIFLYSQSDS